MKKSPPPIGIGVVSIMTVLLVLTLSVFSALTLTSARADLSLSQTNADTVSAYYAADAQAAAKINEIALACADSVVKLADRSGVYVVYNKHRRAEGFFKRLRQLWYFPVGKLSVRPELTAFRQIDTGRRNRDDGQICVGEVAGGGQGCNCIFDKLQACREGGGRRDIDGEVVDAFTAKIGQHKNWLLVVEIDRHDVFIILVKLEQNWFASAGRHGSARADLLDNADVEQRRNILRHSGFADMDKARKGSP